MVWGYCGAEELGQKLQNSAPYEPILTELELG